MQTHRVACNKIASDTKKQLGGAKYKVYDSKGKKVYEFTTGKKAEFIEGMFKAGETYTFKEVDAPEHYKVAKDKKIRIKDTCLLYTSQATLHCGLPCCSSVAVQPLAQRL